LGHGCQQAKVSSYQKIIQGTQGFYKSLPWLFNRNLLLKNVNVAIYFYLFIAILCAKILCVNSALQRTFETLNNPLSLALWHLVTSPTQRVTCFMEMVLNKYNIESNCSLRPMSHETFLHTILWYFDKKILWFLSIGFN